MPANLAAKLATQLSRALIGKPEVVRYLLTGLFGFCPAYKLFGLRTCPLQR